MGKRCYCESLIVGNLSNNNGNGSENVSKKAGFVLFQTLFLLFHFIPFFLMLGNSSGVDSKGWYLSSEKEKEKRCLAFTSSRERETRKFHVIVVQQQQRKSTKKRNTCTKLLFCQSKPVAFLPFSLPPLFSLLKLPYGVLFIWSWALHVI